MIVEGYVYRENYDYLTLLLHFIPALKNYCLINLESTSCEQSKL